MAEHGKLRILIVDDHAIVRAGLRLILSDSPDLSIVSEADTASQALQLARETNFDLVLLDISLPDRNGLDLLSQLKRESPSLRVLMLSIYPENKYGIRAIKSGASGYLNKQCAPGHLVEAIQHVSAGRKYITPALAEELASEVGVDYQALPHESLSNREFQTLCMIASGLTVSAIANKLGLSVKTVSMYRARLLEKMHLENNNQLTHYAILHNLIELEPNRKAS